MKKNGRSAKRIGCGLAMAASLCTFAQAGFAQSAGSDALALNRYSPNFAGDRFFGVSSPHTLGHPGIHVALIGDYAHNPLVLRREVEGEDALEIGAVVEHQLHMHLNGTFALWNRVAVNVNIPVAVFQDGDDPVSGNTTFVSPSAAAFGDIRVGLRGRLLGDYHDAFQLALGAQMWIPSGPADEGDFVGDGGVRFLPQVILGGEAGRFIYAMDVGPEIRSSKSFAGIPQSTMLRYGIGLGGLLGPERRFQLGVDVLGAIVVEDVQSQTTNLEALAGIKWRFVDPLVAGLAAGPGLTGGIGTPDFRGLLSIAYTPKPPAADAGAGDRDSDGIPDEEDACPIEAGVPNDDAAQHGCPAPAVAADGDSDGDGIKDAVDACPQVAGVSSEDPTKHGCPAAPDGDKDGISDDADACPAVAGVANADATRNGCPPSADRDGDGISDGDDACPGEAGVANADPSRHGCAAPVDSDGDGIFDAVDACPNKAGKANSNAAKNGCPTVVVSAKEIVILERIEFDLGNATIRPVSDTLLNEIADIFKANMQIELVEVQGHTDKRGLRAYNKQLSLLRARSVVNALVSRGVARTRLTPKGYGPDKLLSKEDTEEAHQQNRRVQFVILKQKARGGVSVGTKAVNH